MSDTHTPGPWRVSMSTLGAKLLIEHGDETTVSPIIGSVYADDGRLPAIDNARLIVAAPDTLNVLNDAPTPPFEHFTPKLMTAWIDVYIRWYQTRCAVIAKAEGREP